MGFQLDDPFKQKLLSKEQLNDILQIPIGCSLFIDQELYDIDEKEFSFRIIDSLEYDYSIEIDYISLSFGTAESTGRSFWGWVQQIDYENDSIKMINDEDTLEVLFNDIVAVRKK